MEVRRGDYCIVSLTNAKPFLIKVTAADEDTISGIKEEHSHIEEARQAVDVRRETVILNLGRTPYPGRVYGVDAGRLHLGKIEDPIVGNLHFFYKPKKKVVRNVQRAVRMLEKSLKKHQLHTIMADPIYWEFEPADRQKYAGMYESRKLNGAVVSRIKTRPEILNASDYQYVLAHELAHHMHHHYIKRNEVLEARWIDMYNRTVLPSDIKEETCTNYLDSLLNSGVTSREYRMGLDTEERTEYMFILREIRRTHKISEAEINSLITAELKDSVRHLWPRSVSKTQVEPIVSEYATTNYKELIAESFAFYLTGVKLPKAVTKLVERSLSYIKTQI